MRLNRQLLLVNRNLLVCAVATTVQSAILAEVLASEEHHLSTAYVLIASFATFIAIFSVLFWQDARRRHPHMTKFQRKMELYSVFHSMILGEVLYLIVRYLSHFYLLEGGAAPYIAATTAKIVSDVFFHVVVTWFLRITKTF